ncbi:Uncharacterised protein [Vibrio cholerae]|nr:Uncharacterised protein [Vibrio cholerae]
MPLVETKIGDVLRFITEETKLQCRLTDLVQRIQYLSL